MLNTLMIFELLYSKFTHLITLLIGVISWEGVKFLYPEVKQIIEKRREASSILHKNLDISIKSADELFGKIESLAREDFASFINKSNSNSESPEHNQIYVCYLVAQFWACLEIIRLQSNYNSITRFKKGKEFIRFIETIESRKFRILDRSKQRIIAEGMILNSGDKFQIIPLYLFFDKLSSDKAFRFWINELKSQFLEVKRNEVRQRILVHGVIVAIFLDHFDNKGKVSRRRNIYLNKLRPESVKLISNVLLNHYLPFIKQRERYFLK